MTETIAELTARLKTEYESAREMFRRGAVHALNCGALLNEIKAELGFGHWEHWLKTESPVAPRTARRYQYLANNKAKLEANLPNLADLTVYAAEQFLKDERLAECQSYDSTPPSRPITYGVRERRKPLVAGPIFPVQEHVIPLTGGPEPVVPLAQDTVLAEAERELEGFEFRYRAWPELVQGARELRAKVARIRKEGKGQSSKHRLRIVH